MNRSTQVKDDTRNTLATQNACKLCAPLGASLVFKGIRGAVPMLHGSQGCATYIRRYLISHFKEPMDIACSNFSEQTAIFGGGANLELAIENICGQYSPEIIGVATTCLSETIGDDVPRFLNDLRRRNPELIPVVHVSSPSYTGTHMDGFHGAVRATVAHICSSGHPTPRALPPQWGQGAGATETGTRCNLFAGMVSTADLRHLKTIVSDFGLVPVVLPDYSETLDGPMWSEYQKIPSGGTPVSDIRTMPGSAASIEFGRILAGQPSAGKDLDQGYAVACHSIGLPVGINETDRFFDALETISGNAMPEKYANQRGRLIDAYADGHKYVSGIRVAIYGEEDLVCAMAAFASEIGMIPVLCASGGASGRMKDVLAEILPDGMHQEIRILEGADFVDIETEAAELAPQMLIGSSKGYSIARRLEIPLLRVGFPVHDRFGGSRILHVGYQGAQQLFDRIVNAVIETRQSTSKVGYAYM